MVTVRPFRGVRYNLEKALLKHVVSPPYDVISESERESFKTKSPYNVVHLILPEGKNKYNNAGKLYNQWKSEKVLVKDDVPSFYVYEQEYRYEGKKYVRTGFVGLMKLEEFGKGKVFPHEKTLAGPKKDRYELMKACKANFSQIFGLYLDKENELEKAFASAKKTMPAASAVDDDGVKNSLWLIQDQDIVNKISRFMSNKSIYIADGHHRYETSLNLRDFFRKQNKDAADELKPYDFAMMMFVNFYDEGLKIFPTHRVVDIDDKFDEKVFFEKLENYFVVEEIEHTRYEKFLNKKENCKIVMVYGDKYYGLSIKDDDYEKLHPVYRRVDTYILQELILKGVMGFSEDKLLNKEGISFMQSEEKVREAAEKNKAVGFILNGVPIEVVREISENGYVMPQKSTYFYPKLQTGLVFNDI
ncbi:DUF1015 domain-containing protein [Flexistipes sp.]|uniref:DUF1015 domain-containing protein n=1 Tax=Flexistipes sp. TaxID=3088135 RepID=UPI002E24E4CD|nr:DUF1015 domain-containing protein [Flexistipes sp.]